MGRTFYRAHFTKLVKTFRCKISAHPPKCTPDRSHYNFSRTIKQGSKIKNLSCRKITPNLGSEYLLGFDTNCARLVFNISKERGNVRPRGRKRKRSDRECHISSREYIPRC